MLSSFYSASQKEGHQPPPPPPTHIMGLLCSKGSDDADDARATGPGAAPLPPRRVSELVFDGCETAGMVYTGSTAEEADDDAVLPRCKSISKDGALFRSATRRRARLSRRKAGTVRSLGRDTGTGAQVDLVVQSRPQTTLTDSVVERMLQQCEAARSSPPVPSSAVTAAGTAAATAAAAEPTTTSPPTSELLDGRDNSDETNKGEESCDTSLYSSAGDDTINLQPVRRKVQTLTDEQVQAMLAQAA